MIFGGGAGAIALAAGRVSDEDEDVAQMSGDDDILLSDFVPVTQTHGHAVYWGDEGPDDHDHEDEELFLF